MYSGFMQSTVGTVAGIEHCTVTRLIHSIKAKTRLDNRGIWGIFARKRVEYYNRTSYERERG